MPADPVRRRAARIATLVAIPVALLIGLVSLWRFGAFEGEPSPPAVPTAQATSPVDMPAPTLAPDAAAVCQALVADLPAAIRQAQRRPVAAGVEQNAAYGDPPITLACGAPAPSYPATALLSTLDGVCWYAEGGAAGSVWTTVDRRVPVRVTVPAPADGSAQSVIPFSPAIVTTVPKAQTVPSGCTP